MMNPEKIELRELSIKDGNDIFTMINEIGPGENGFNNDGYGMDETGFKEYLLSSMDISRGIRLPSGYVQQTKYWLIIDGLPVGYAKLRHYLNDSLRKNGGHIGYCIRPSARGKGYGNILLKEMLEKARELHIPKALVTCNEPNLASRRVIEYNGGSLENTDHGKCYFWINLTEQTGIRKIHIDDYSEIFALWSSTAGLGMTSADSEEKIHAFLGRNDGLSFCYQENGKIVGTSLCGHDGHRGYIYHVCVAEEYRKKGIGNQLVENSLKGLREQGIEKCHLFAFKDNEPGNAFWKKTGWIKREDIFAYSRII